MEQKRDGFGTDLVSDGKLKCTVFNFKVVVLLVGTNNVAHTPSHTAANIVEGIEAIVWYINGINSNIKVLVLVSILCYFSERFYGR